MKNTLIVYTQKDVCGDVYISISAIKELDSRKSQLYISESKKKQLEEKVNSIHNELKKSKNYLSTSLGFEEIDWYTDETDMFDVPYFKIVKGEKKVDVSSYTYGSIPKDWEQVITIKFTNCKRYTAVVKAINLLGCTLTPKDRKSLVECIKMLTEFEKFF